MTQRQQFDEFIVTYLDNAHNLAYRYVKNQTDAEDVVAMSIGKALYNIHTLRDPELMKGWFNKIVINTSINHLRKKPKIVSLREAIPVCSVDDFSRIELEDLLDILPPNDKRILSLRFVDNRQINEIAEILGMNENTVKTRLYRSLKKLKLEITKDDSGAMLKDGKKTVKALTVAIAAVLLSATAIFNLSPTLAAAAYDIPLLGDIVRVITFNRFEYSDKGYSAEILVPEIQGLLDPELQDRINAEFREYADELILSFEASIPELEELESEYSDVHVNPPTMSIKADYTVKTDNDRILSIDAYIYSETNGFVLHKFCTIDKKAGALITLSDLFRPDADYITPISEYLAAEMLRLNKEEETDYNIGDNNPAIFTAIKPDAHFYISDGGKLVICFDKYEVAAGYMGSPEFIIPHDAVKDILDSDLIAEAEGGQQ